MSLEEIWKLLWCFFSNVWLIKKEKKKKTRRKLESYLELSSR
jgi:hypothetical protein